MPYKYQYPDGTEYFGDWNDSGQRDGLGHMKFPDGATYVGMFKDGLCDGLGVMSLGDQSRYEGEFSLGKFAGVGVFRRCDGMLYEGEFRDGKIWGLGLLTFADGTHGIPKNEGYFENGALSRRDRCPTLVMKARQLAEKARQTRV